MSDWATLDPVPQEFQFLFITLYLSFNPTFSQINEHNRKKLAYKFFSAAHQNEPSLDPSLARPSVRDEREE